MKHLPLVEQWDNLTELWLRVEGGDENEDDRPVSLPSRITCIVIRAENSATTEQVVRLMEGVRKATRLVDIDLAVPYSILSIIDWSSLCHLQSLTKLIITSRGEPWLFSASQVAALVNVCSKLKTLAIDSAIFVQLLQGGAQFPLLTFLALYNICGRDIASLVGHIAKDKTYATPLLSFTSLSFRGTVSAEELSLFSRLITVTKCKLYDDTQHAVDFRGLGSWTHMKAFHIYAFMVTAIVLPPHVETVMFYACKTQHSLEWLSAFPSIQTLGLHGLYMLQESDLIHLQDLRNLRCLYLSLRLRLSPLLRAFLQPPACHGMFPRLEDVVFT
jgi:hypothetical protein